MNSYERHVLRRIIQRVLFIGLLILAPLWLIQALHFLALVPGQHISPLFFFRVTLLLLPSAFAVILPLACCIAILTIYQHVSQRSEGAALSNAGLSPTEILRPAWITGVCYFLVGYMFSCVLIPQSWRQFHQLERNIRAEIKLSALPARTFVHLGAHLTVYAEENRNGVLDGLILNDDSDGKSVDIFASRAELIRNNDVAALKLLDGSLQKYNPRSQKLSVLKFNQIVFPLPSAREQSPPLSDRSLNALFRDLNPQDRSGKILAEIANRLSFPLYNAIYIWILCYAIGSCMGRKYPTLYKTRAVLGAFALIGLLTPLQFFLTSSLKTHEWPIIVLFGLPVAILGVLIVRFRTRRKTISTEAK